MVDPAWHFAPAFMSCAAAGSASVAAVNAARDAIFKLAFMVFIYCFPE
jgi:hypothetical protein